MNFFYFIYRSLVSPFKNAIVPASGCKFYPTCSDYSLQAVKKYGFFKGSCKSVLRFFSCNPFNQGGIDLP